jgi:hypothetical protein
MEQADEQTKEGHGWEIDLEKTNPNGAKPAQETMVFSSESLITRPSGSRKLV